MTQNSSPRRVVELFAGVGGFRLGMEPHGFHTVWANQWEPATKAQHAWDCVRSPVLRRRPLSPDVERSWTRQRSGEFEVPDHEVLVGGFPCFVAGTIFLTESGYRPIEELVGRPGPDAPGPMATGDRGHVARGARDARPARPGVPGHPHHR